MKKTINLDLIGDGTIRYIKLTKDETIDPIMQRVLTLLVLSVEDYVKTEEGNTIIDTLYSCNSGDIHQVAALMSDVMSNVRDVINESDPVIETLDIELSVDGTKVKAVINITKYNGDTVSTAVY